MSLANVKAFYERLATDENFRLQIQEVQSKEKCSQIVKEAGYDFSQEELEEFTASLLESNHPQDGMIELEEKEMEAVFGGAIRYFEPAHRLFLMYGGPSPNIPDSYFQ
jgi:predicted ribosomally synthesized peptide with nif11-like leader